MARQSPGKVAAMVVAAVACLMRPVAASEPTVEIRIKDLAGVPANVLTGAQDEISRIYRNAGVDVVYKDATAPTEASSARGLLLVIVPARVGDKIAMSRSAMGVAITSRNSPGSLAYILYNRVETFAETNDTNVSLVLGHAMAHEIGHLLLSTGHSLAGLMRATWNQHDLIEAGRGWLMFTPGEAATIRAHLSEAR